MKLVRTDREGFKKQLFYLSELLKAYTSDPFFKSYNLNNEKDIREYISWFDAALVSIKASLSRKLLEEFITEESAKQLFIDLVKQTNDKIQEKMFVLHFEI